MSRYALLLILWTWTCAGADWSVIIYAQTDEEDLSEVTRPILEKLVKAPLGSGVELIMERDGFEGSGSTRYVRRGSRAVDVTWIAEEDSAGAGTFERFLEWSSAQATGRYRMLLVITHAWNWRHIFDDYNLPGKPDENSKMPLAEFGHMLREAETTYDVLYFDACGLGVAEALEEVAGSARYVVASQLGSPMVGFPYQSIFEIIAKPAVSPRELVAALPGEYVRAYARGGQLVEAVGGYHLVTLTSVDMERWREFSVRLGELTGMLRGPWFGFSNDDGYVDLLEFLQGIGTWAGAAASKLAAELVANVGYPEEISRATNAMFRFDPARVESFRAWIEADERVPWESALESMKEEWFTANAGLRFPNEIEFGLSDDEHGGRLHRWLTVEGSVEEAFSMRPWLPGTRRVVFDLKGRGEGWVRRELSRERDYFYVREFPSSSFLVAEAHTQGAPYLHGVGVFVNPGRGETKTYENTRWSLHTGWSGFISPR